MDITSSIFLFVLVYLISFRFNLINYFKNPTKIIEFEDIKYICDKIIPLIELEKLHIYFKTRVVGAILG